MASDQSLLARERSAMSQGRLVVAIPVKDEVDHFSDCLNALAHQSEARALTILALVNNTSDGSAAAARAFPLPPHVSVLVEEVVLPPAQANAGGARRRAMTMAAQIAGDDGIVLTTDADGRVGPNWLRANLAAIERGADAVAGRAIIDPIDEALIPTALLEADARECRYAALLDEIAAAIDPDAWDPWPRHSEHSGASIAVTVSAFRRAGGIPDLAMGEDRAFFRNLRRADARIRHAADAWVVVSGRTEGRAVGGMADTIRRRMACPDIFLDDRLEAVQDAVLRARLRRQARLLWADGAADYWAICALARALQLPSGVVREALAHTLFGAGWDEIENASPALRRHPVPAASVNQEIVAARAILSAWQTPAEADIQATA